VSHEFGSLAWNRDGTALYILSNSRIVRQQIDRRGATPRDSGETVLSGLSDASSLSLTRDGRLLAITRGPTSARNMAVTVPASGNLAGVEAVPLSSGTVEVDPPAVSPDGHWVAWSEWAGPVVSVVLAPLTSGTPRVIVRYDGLTTSDLRWAPDSRRFAYFVGDSSPYDLYTATTDGAVPNRVTTSAGIPSYGDWAWAKEGLILPDSGERGFLLVDPSSGHALPLASNDSLDLYSPLLSPDGRTLIAARGRPFGFWNEVWQHRVGAGAGVWAQVPSTTPGDPVLLRWDESGIYAAIRRVTGRNTAKHEIWRARSPGAPFTPLLTGLRWCTSFSAPSLSDDNRHLACRQTSIASDVWLVTGFDAGAR
jgi:hypothetical protein